MVTSSTTTVSNDAGKPYPPRVKYLLIHAFLLCLFGLAWLLDEPISRAADEWYNGPVELSGEVRQLIISLAQYAQPIGLVIAGTLIWTFDRSHRGRVVVLSAAVLLSGLASSVGKAVSGRERPRDSEGTYVFHGLVHSLPDSKTASFPSGHTATAFAQSYVLAAMYPAASRLIWPLAIGVAINRVATVRHFPSDVVAGMWLGLVVGGIIMNWSWLWSWAERANRAWSRPREIAAPAVGLWWHSLQEILSSRRMLAVVCLVMFWVGNGSYSLWDRDEPRFATASREMALRGDWVVPTFNGDLRPDKPILIYWLQRSAYAVLGDGPFAARFWSGIGGMLACLLTWELGQRMFGRPAGQLAGWMLALSPMLIIESKLGTVDAILLASIVTAMLALWQVYDQTESSRWWILFWVALSLGILTKGPVAVLVPVLVMMTISILDRDLSWLGRLRPVWGLSMVVVLVLPWCLLVQSATKGEFLSLAIGHHVVTRALQPLENHTGFPGYYAVSLLGLMAPWSLLLPWGLWNHGRRLREDRRLRFLLAWGVTTWIAFELVRTKLVHYYLPAYPAWAIVLSASLVGVFGSEPIGLTRLPRLSFGRAMIGLGCLFVVVGAGVSFWLLPASLAIAVVVTLLVGGLGLAMAGGLFSTGHFREAVYVQMAAGAVMITLAGGLVLPRVHSSQVILEVADRLRELGEDEVIALWYYRDPSLIYNMRRQVKVIDPLREKPPLLDARALAREEGMFVCPVLPPQLVSMQSDPELSVRVRETLSKWDVQGLRERQVHLVEVRPAGMVGRPTGDMSR
jgi:4-amino-4-deoxy-L-arabinose transferase-like glycosyltransferase/membrane-associated phospholipid phosphatase